jgi:ATP-dependent Lon protease
MNNQENPNDDDPLNKIFIYIEELNKDPDSQRPSYKGGDKNTGDETKKPPRRNPSRKAKSKKNDKKPKNTTSNSTKRKSSKSFENPFFRDRRPPPPNPFGFPPIFSFILGGPEDDDENSCRGPKYKALRDKIKNSNLEDSVKTMCLERLKNCDSDKQKYMEWFENLLKIPFKKYSNLPVSINDPIENIHSFFEESQNILNNSVYGLDKVKEEIINYIGQFISTNNMSSPRVIGLQGSAGVGKTKIIKSGLSECIKRPMKFLSMGGVRDSSHFLGFDFTYSGSRHGIIVQSLIDTGVMNPIIFMDELDKISNTTEGIDVQNLLIHLTDPVQNMKFHDKYYAGIDIDLSKVVFVFSFNDIELVNPILRDRINIIKVPDPSEKEKIVIGKNFLTKEIAPNVGLKIDDIIFTDETVKHIITKFCKNDKGVRGLKKCIETLMLKINTSRFLGKLQKYKTLEKVLKTNNLFPLEMTIEIIDELIDKEHNPKDELISHMFM